MATQRKHKRRTRQQSGRFLKIYVMMCALIIVAAVVAGSMGFFKAHTFVVEGNERYTTDELLEATEIKDGDNLFRIPRQSIVRRMEESLPYLKEVKIRLLPPEKVLVQVQETSPAAVIVSGETMWYVDSAGKLLERVTEDGGYPLVEGITLLAPSEGTFMEVGEEESLKAKGLKGLLTAMEKNGLLDHIHALDVTSSASISMLYDQNLTVKMGLNDDFNYDIKMLRAAEEKYLLENWNDEDSGTLDMTKRSGEAVLSRD